MVVERQGVERIDRRLRLLRTSGAALGARFPIERVCRSSAVGGGRCDLSSLPRRRDRSVHATHPGVVLEIDQGGGDGQLEVRIFWGASEIADRIGDPLVKPSPRAVQLLAGVATRSLRPHVDAERLEPVLLLGGAEDEGGAARGALARTIDVVVRRTVALGAEALLADVAANGAGRQRRLKVVV